MLTNIYVIDYIVQDLDRAKADLDRVFATEPLWIDPAMAPGKSYRAMYYQMPDDPKGVHAIGLFEASGDAPRVAHDGVVLLGILCDDVEASTAEIRARGLAFHYPEPQRYAVGRNNIVGPLNGLSFSIAQHDPGGYRSAQAMMRTADGHTDFGDPGQAGLLVAPCGVDLLVNDLDDAIANYRALFGCEPVPTGGAEAVPGLRTVRFAAPNAGSGIQWLGLTAIEAADAGPKARTLATRLADRGEGLYRITFAVRDADEMRRRLIARGVALAEADDVEIEDPRGAILRFAPV